ncbi:MAG TPA: hypothetical protein PLO37_06745 [Candidatus Hydrogenedentes bacterium]|nr:hypothetical protein [Candidatus Hydrogenedentota bacterium]HPG66529.1 hypothetical protein [Candidatus Hydrogenedentota bacterium]
MKTSSSLWRRLERLAGHAAVMVEWRMLLGPCFEHFERYLRPTEREATQILCAGQCTRGCSRRIVRHGPRDIVALCPEDECSIDLEPEDCVIHEIDAARLLVDMGRGLGIEAQPEPLAGFPAVYRLGASYLPPSCRIPIIVSLNGDPETFAKAAAHLVLFDDAPFLLVGLTRRVCPPGTEAVLRRQSAIFVSLDGYLDCTGAGFVPRFPLRDFFCAEQDSAGTIPEGATVIERVEHGHEVRWLVNGVDRGAFSTRATTIKARILNILYDQAGLGWVPHRTFLQAVGWSHEEYFGSSTEPGRMQKQLTEIRKFLGVAVGFSKLNGVRFAEEVVKSR